VGPRAAAVLDVKAGSEGSGLDDAEKLAAAHLPRSHESVVQEARVQNSSRASAEDSVSSAAVVRPAAAVCAKCGDNERRAALRFRSCGALLVVRDRFYECPFRPKNFSDKYSPSNFG
jgi:hypothetical protein